MDWINDIIVPWREVNSNPSIELEDILRCEPYQYIDIFSSNILIESLN